MRSAMVRGVAQRRPMAAGVGPKKVAFGQRRGVVKASEQGVVKEKQLQDEAHSWGAPSDELLIREATEEDVPTLDLDSPTFSEDLRDACVRVGFYVLKNHGVSHQVIADGFKASEEFFQQPSAAKLALAMDEAPEQPGGTGFLPVNNFKLPKRVKGNLTECFVLKREHGPRNVTLDSNPWPADLGPGWRARVERYAEEMERLCFRLLEKYAEALEVPVDELKRGFESPLWRLRFNHYPAVKAYEAHQYGISPHVDTTLFTILAQREPGLVVHSAERRAWLRVAGGAPARLVVNTGEILRNLTNDTWLSTRHYALNATSQRPRYSIPFFFCPTADYKMPVFSSFVTDECPAKYPPTSYLDGQGIAQGE
ncbi:Gibberellin 3-beta-dioxygenase 4 [Diplonema papillatum]|nr:Gibberellin 3-beta-dioxygenase 4 [Diplonema papillatum]